ncbi:MAG: TonB family protein [Cyclobacteriaceae bacterium]
MNAENTFTRLDDVVFENRNKLYGAYSIRHAYQKNLSKASFYGTVFLAVLFLMYHISTLLHQAPVISGVIKDPFTHVFVDPVIIADPPPQKQIAQTQVVSRDLPPQVVTTVPTEQPQIETQTIQSSTVGGTEGSPQPFDGGQIGTTTTTVVVSEPPQVFDHAEVMPEFEGGIKALYRFLNKNLRYPTAARKMDEEGTVYVRFIVDATGVVTGIEVAKGISGSLDREATRVIGLMPKWKPGRQHDSPVNVRLMVPIKFAMQDE